jgi:Family of unknown function (DUF5985)
VNPAVEEFLLGVIATAMFTIGLLFLKFWRRTRDALFLAFGAAFVIEALNHISLLFMRHPNTADTGYYIVRLFSFLLILAGILKKNYGRR